MNAVKDWVNRGREKGHGNERRGLVSLSSPGDRSVEQLKERVPEFEDNEVTEHAGAV